MSDKPRAAIVGVTGFIGRGLPSLLAERGMECTGISRSPGRSLPGVDRWQVPDDLDFRDHKVIINLAGEPINQRWNEENKRRFHESRVGTTRRIVQAIRVLPADERPRLLINGSAVGIYGDRGDEVLTESAAPGHGYLAGLCKEWEEAALEAEALGVRVVLLRTGIVLGRDGDAFQQLLRIFKLGIGGRLGSGRQWMPWIHVDDLRGAIVHAASSEHLRGPLNGSAPSAERNADFTRKLAAALHRPAVFPVPGFALKLMLGEFATALLGGQHARPAALEADGFQFRHPTLESALADLIR